MEEVAQHYSKQSIKFLRVDTGELAYSNMIKMGITTTPVVRLHTQVSKQSIPLYSIKVDVQLQYKWSSMHAQALFASCRYNG